jgi:hypothetical protein
MITVVFIFFFALSSFGIAVAVAAAITGKRSRGWESPSRLLIREILCTGATAVVFLGYHNEYFGEFVTLAFLGIVGGGVGGCLVWNDRKYAIESGNRWDFL